MSYMRQIGYRVRQAIKIEPDKELALQKALALSPSEVRKLCDGRMYLSFSELGHVAQILGMSFEELQKSRPCDYQCTVLCMTPFSKEENLDTIRDLLDAYIDAKEALCC